jgi:hypothetical protein
LWRKRRRNEAKPNAKFFPIFNHIIFQNHLYLIMSLFLSLFLFSTFANGGIIQSRPPNEEVQQQYIAFSVLINFNAY